MNYKRLLFVFVAVLTSAFIFYMSKDKSGYDFKDPEGVYPNRVRMIQTIDLYNVAGRDSGPTRVWVYAPLEINAKQRLQEISATKDYRQFKDGSGNNVLYYELDELKAGEVFKVKVDSIISTSDVLNPIAESDAQRYKAREDGLDFDSSRIKELSAQTQADSEQETVANIQEFLKNAFAAKNDENVKAESSNQEGSDGKSEVNQAEVDSAINVPTVESEPAKFNMENILSLDSVSQVQRLYALLSLARSDGLAARGVVGYCAVGASTDAAKPCVWGELLLDGLWKPIDLTDFKEVNDMSKHIAIRVLDVIPQLPNWDPDAMFVESDKLSVSSMSARLRALADKN